MTQIPLPRVIVSSGAITYFVNFLGLILGLDHCMREQKKLPKNQICCTGRDTLTRVILYSNPFENNEGKNYMALTPFFGNGAGGNGIGKISGALTKIGKFDIVLMYDSDVSIARLIPLIIPSLFKKAMGILQSHQSVLPSLPKTCDEIQTNLVCELLT